MPFHAKTVPPGSAISDELAGAIKKAVLEGSLSCAGAFEVAEELNVPRPAVGCGADVLHIPLSNCQLGLFGYPGKERLWESPGYMEPAVAPQVVEAILATQDRNGKITCEALMAIADRFGILRAVAGRAADRAGVRVIRCQLGAFP
jgi:hypothetical protein